MVRVSKKIIEDAGIDCRLKEFLGYYNGKLYGTYKYTQAVDGVPKTCMCKPSEMLIDPIGGIHRCHYELYNHKNSYAHILDGNVKLIESYNECKTLGLCNGCDCKIKTDRFQQDNWCSVTIKLLIWLDRDI